VAVISTRRVLTVAALTAAGSLTALGAGTGGAAYAGQLTKETFRFSDPFGGSFDCGTFAGSYVGHDHGLVMTWFDAHGDPVRQQGKITAVETDTNERTGATVVVRTRLNVHVDFLADRQTLTGIRNLSTEPGRGVVIQSVGRRLSTTDGTLLDFSGPADDILRGGGFCEALSG
jgi:hypothetical protein